MELLPEGRAWLGLTGLMPVLPAEEYWRLTEHYGKRSRVRKLQEHEARQRAAREIAAKRQDACTPAVKPEVTPVVTLAVPAAFALDDPSNPLAAINYALDRLFRPDSEKDGWPQTGAPTRGTRAQAR